MANNDSLKGILHRFPLLQNGSFGKLGPGFGYGVGCGVGLGAGIIGATSYGLLCCAALRTLRLSSSEIWVVTVCRLR
eukprot:c21991_g1_i3 orf=442-672(-)